MSASDDVNLLSKSKVVRGIGSIQGDFEKATGKNGKAEILELLLPGNFGDDRPLPGIEISLPALLRWPRREDGPFRSEAACQGVAG